MMTVGAESRTMRRIEPCRVAVALRVIPSALLFGSSGRVGRSVVRIFGRPFGYSVVLSVGRSASRSVRRQVVHTVGCSIGRQFGQPFDWSVGRSVRLSPFGSSIGRSFRQPFVWSVCLSPVSRSVGRSDIRLLDRSVDRPVGRSFIRSVVRSVDRSVSHSVGRCACLRSVGRPYGGMFFRWAAGRSFDLSNRSVEQSPSVGGVRSLVRAVSLSSSFFVSQI